MSGLGLNGPLADSKLSKSVLYLVGVREPASVFSSGCFSGAIWGGLFEGLLARKECLFSRSFFSLGLRKAFPGY